MGTGGVGSQLRTRTGPRSKIAARRVARYHNVVEVEGNIAVVCKLRDEVNCRSDVLVGHGPAARCIFTVDGYAAILHVPHRGTMLHEVIDSWRR